MVSSLFCQWCPLTIVVVRDCWISFIFDQHLLICSLCRRQSLVRSWVWDHRCVGRCHSRGARPRLSSSFRRWYSGTSYGCGLLFFGMKNLSSAPPLQGRTHIEA
jgi:hypothetical protein